MKARNKILILLSALCLIALIYYFVSTPRSKDLVLIGTVDSNQVIVSSQIQGRIAKLLVDEGTQVKQGDPIAILRNCRHRSAPQRPRLPVCDRKSLRRGLRKKRPRVQLPVMLPTHKHDCKPRTRYCSRRKPRCSGCKATASESLS